MPLLKILSKVQLAGVSSKNWNVNSTPTLHLGQQLMLDSPTFPKQPKGELKSKRTVLKKGPGLIQLKLFIAVTLTKKLAPLRTTIKGGSIKSK